MRLEVVIFMWVSLLLAIQLSAPHSSENALMAQEIVVPTADATAMGDYFGLSGTANML